MDKTFNNNFKNSILTGFIDNDLESDILYQPELLVNRKIPRKKVLTSIINELENCNCFYISVAFVTTGGVAALINSFDFDYSISRKWEQNTISEINVPPRRN